MKYQELKSKSADEVAKMLTERRLALKNFRFNISGSKAKNIREGRNIRKDVARLLTFLRNNSK